MDELQRKQRFRKLLYSYPVLAVLTIMTLLLARGAISLMYKERESAARVAELEGKNLTLHNRRVELEEGINRLQTAEGVMEEIKSKFSVEREGEKVAIIVDERAQASSSQAVVVESGVRKWWKKLSGLWSNSDSGYNATQ